MASKTLVLVTGANQGLGYYTAQQLAHTGNFHVLVGSRDITKAHNAIETLASDESLKVSADSFEAVQIDVTSDASIAAAVKQVNDKYGKLDVLVNNAGIAQAQDAASDESGASLREIYRAHYDTNVFGIAVVTDAFLPLLRKSSVKRITYTSSGLSSLKLAADLDGPMSAINWPIYRSTKTALNMIMLYYARLLEPEGFVVSAADPGYCGTNLNGFSGFKDPRDGAKEIVKTVSGGKDEVHGVVISEEGVLPW